MSKKEQDSTVFDDLMESLEDEKADETEAMDADDWELDTKGSVLRGIFLSAERKPTKYGSGYEALIRDIDTDVLVRVWCLRGTLRDGIRKAAPKVGSEIVFINNGQQDGKDGRNDWWWYQVKAISSNAAYWAELDKVQPDEVRKSIEAADKKRETESYDEQEAPF